MMFKWGKYEVCFLKNINEERGEKRFGDSIFYNLFFM